MKKIWTRSVAGILSFFMALMMFNMPVYADSYEVQEPIPIEMIENDVATNFVPMVEDQDTGWYKQKDRDGSVSFDKLVADAIIQILMQEAPEIARAAAQTIANEIIESQSMGAYYTRYLNSQVVDKCTQRYYYSYDWYSDPLRTNYIGTTNGGIQTINLCRR